LSPSLTKKNKEERYSRVPRHSDTRYTAKGTKGKWRSGRTLQSSTSTIRYSYSAKGTKGKWRYAIEIELRHLPVISINGYVGGRQI